MAYQTLTITKIEAQYIENFHPVLSFLENVRDQRINSEYDYIVNLESRDDNQENLERINEILNTAGPNKLNQ